MSSCNAIEELLLCGRPAEDVVKTETALAIINHSTIILDASITRFPRLPEPTVDPYITTPILRLGRLRGALAPPRILLRLLLGNGKTILQVLLG